MTPVLIIHLQVQVAQISHLQVQVAQISHVKCDSCLMFMSAFLGILCSPVERRLNSSFVQLFTPIVHFCPF